MTENWRHTHTHTCSRWDPTDEHVTHSSSWTSASTLDEHWESFTGNLQYFCFPKEPFRNFSLYKEDSVRWKDSTDANKEALFVCVCVWSEARLSSNEHLTSTHRWRFIKREAHVIQFKDSDSYGTCESPECWQTQKHICFQLRCFEKINTQCLKHNCEFTWKQQVRLSPGQRDGLYGICPSVTWPAVIPL